MKSFGWMALAAAFALPALSQDGSAGGAMRHVVASPASGKLGAFETIDRDGDGFLSWEEVRNTMARLFHEADRDGSGALGFDEIIFSERLHKLSDRSGDGAVDARELMAEAAAVFHLADVDDDGKLSRAETTAAEESEGIR